ncbi:lipopolysaccharide assembly protein LapB [Oceanicoccus sp. KOV_DT_Chl]|uniref:tetratricopeptide repeat protein n=1 Tax=Oceanicoccus sp. KOV_DT_Chl TaxID=1904639 RepID=UPI000C7AB194|nr:tetratricopeptide repeat protein [Oceanicoccus sp. KOV_DT_Chl]
MLMNALPLTTLKHWGRALVVSIPVLAAQAVVPALLQTYTDQALPGVAFAQEEEQKKEQKTKRTQAMNNKVYEKLQAAQEAVEAKDLKGGLEILDDLKNGKKPLNDAEMANVLNMYAFIYYSQEDYPRALKSYADIIKLPEAPEGTLIQARYSLAQLYFVTEDYEKGVKALLEWFEVTTLAPASAYMLLSQGYYQLKEYDLSLKNVEIAINMYKESGKVPKENWYGLQRFLYYEKENYKKVVAILDELLLHYPKKQYWMQLSGMYSELKDDSRQLAAMETAYVQGMLSKEKELVNMAYLFLASDVPYKAAKVLDAGIKSKVIEPTSKNLDLLGSSWRQAQEIKKAIPEMAKAASKSDKGELWSRLCSVYLDNDEFQQAVDACDKGLKKGGVKRVDTAYLVKGMAHFNLKQYKSARESFKNAAKDERSKKYADQWIKFMDKELERQRSLEEV